MIKITNNILLALVFIGVGGIAGWFVRDWFCADTSEQIVEQIKDDGKKLEEVKKEVEIRYVTRERIKTVVREVPVDVECLDSPDVLLPVADGLRLAFDPERPAPD